MNRRDVPLLAALLTLAAAACAPTMTSRVEKGRVHLTWEAIPVPADATEMRYEVEIHTAEQGLPISHLRTITRLEKADCDPGFLAPGDYVWSVRARYRRLDREWVTRWRTQANARAVALVPQRGFCALTIPK